MRRALVVVLAALSISAHAGVSIELRDASLMTFLQTVVRGVLHRDFVVGSDVPADKRVSIFIRDLDESKALSLALDVLRAQGLAVDDKGGIIFVAGARLQTGADAAALSPSDAGLRRVPIEDAQPEKDMEWIVYRPHHRSVAFLSSVVQLAGAKSMKQGQGGQFSSPGQHLSQTGQQFPQPAVQSGGTSGSLDMLIYGVRDEDRAKVDKLLADVDSPLPAVAVRAVLIEVTDGTDSARSITGALSLLAGRLGITYAAGAAVAGGAVTIKSGNLDAVLGMLDGDSRFKMMSEPRVQVVSGETASFTVGTEVPVRGQLTLSKDGTPLQSVEYRSGGLMLNVTPQVFEGSTLVKVEQQLSSFAITTTSNIDSPSMLKRRVSSTVRATDGEIIMMAGLNEEKESESHSGLFFLPRFLQSSSEQKNRSQLVLLLEVRRQFPSNI